MMEIVDNGKKETANSSQRCKKTTRSYASRVFQESSVGVVASIAHTTSKRRRIYKTIAFLLCLTGFLYQSGVFLEAVFQYPTSVVVNILRPHMLSVPGFTFCDNNSINRKIFCQKFPDKCETPTETFCEKYDGYCGVSETLVPKKEYYLFPKEMTLKEVIGLNVKTDDFVSIENYKDELNDTVVPYLRVRDDSGSNFLCYSFHDRVNNSLLPMEVKENKMGKDNLMIFHFKVREEETFLPGTEPGVLFAVHSPFQAVNPYDIGIFMKPRRRYTIFVSTEKEVLLPKPYKTNCVNYTEIWEKNDRIGPRMQEMCRQNCLAEISLKCYNCVSPDFVFGARERYCTDAEFNRSKCTDDELEDEGEHCFSSCRDDCGQVKFDYTVQAKFLSRFDEDGKEIEDLESTIEAEIVLEGDEVIMLEHSPKYMFVEVFSNIGGFIGCWLGINLLDITDIVEGFFRIIRYSMKRR